METRVGVLAILAAQQRQSAAQVNAEVTVRSLLANKRIMRGAAEEGQ